MAKFCILLPCVPILIIKNNNYIAAALAITSVVICTVHRFDMSGILSCRTVCA